MNYLGIDTKTLKPVAKKLNKLLASYHIYYQNLRSFHWHVKGRSFFDLHNLFEDFYNDAKVKIDDIAERILTLGHKPDGSLRTYLNNSKIKESKDLLKDDDMARQVLENKSELIKIMREVIKSASDVNDEGTVDMISGMLSSMEKETWLLHSWYKRRQVGFAKPKK
ncbi:MAG: DNA starvation/stationary phase protection protein [Saprospiraceae bacterium]|nr:DNA starvation/stationary phase protection protein [Bacteroidia bacterium]NNE14579.1 DNA starvation/stationary phase protection protein [Saprospiraceae bacterium]NNL92622.1 DNA starvation/stationary phase protection protein [Saprospiraceae bacterium]